MSDVIPLAPNKLLTTKTSNEEKIILYLHDKLPRTELSPKLKEELNRYNHCADYIKRYGSRMKVVPMMMKKFGIGQAQAYRDFNSSQKVFATTQEHSQKFWVDILLGFTTEEIRDAKLKGDSKAVAALLATLQKTIKELMGGAEPIPYDQLIAPEVHVLFDPTLLNIPVPDNLDAMISQLKKKKKNISAVDISYEETD